MFSALLRSEIDLLRDTQPAESKPSTEETEVQTNKLTVRGWVLENQMCQRHRKEMIHDLNAVNRKVALV